MKKRIVLLIAFLFVVSMSFTQSGFRIQNGGGLSSDVETNQVSLNNAWFGSSFNYQLTGDQNFNDNFLFNANILYNLDLDLGSWNFPIVGDLTFPLTGGSFEDFEIGLYPWSILSKSLNGNVLVLHGGVSYSVDPESETSLSPQSFKVLGGVELSLPLGNSNLPLTVSVTPFFENYNLDRGSNFGLEGTFIFPIAANLGLIGEAVVPFGSNRSTLFSTGVLVNGAIGGN